MIRKIILGISCLFWVCAMAGGLSGCAGKQATGASVHPGDPFEPVNRKIYVFNDTLDTLILEPAAKGYLRLPKPAQTGITNFANWTGHPLTAFNSFTQLRFNNGWRAVANFAFGLPTIGFWNPFRPEDRPEDADFDQSLALILPPGAYIVLPFLGPGTIRTHSAGIIDSLTDPLYYVKSDHKRKIRRIQTASTVASVLAFRGNNFEIVNNIKYNSADPYARTRALILQSLGSSEASPEEIDDAFEEFFDEEK